MYWKNRIMNTQYIWLLFEEICIHYALSFIENFNIIKDDKFGKWTIHWKHIFIVSITINQHFYLLQAILRKCILWFFVSQHSQKDDESTEFGYNVPNSQHNVMNHRGEIDTSLGLCIVDSWHGTCGVVLMIFWNSLVDGKKGMMNCNFLMNNHDFIAALWIIGVIHKC